MSDWAYNGILFCSAAILHIKQLITFRTMLCPRKFSWAYVLQMGYAPETQMVPPIECDLGYRFPTRTLTLTLMVAVWCSGNALVLINAVALHRARLVLGWVTAFG